MAKKKMFSMRMSDGFKFNIRKQAESLDMTLTEFIRQAIIEKLKRGN